MSAHQWGFSAVIVAVLGMQASTFVTGTVVWPFMAYCMYATPRYPPPSTVSIAVTATLADGRTLTVDHDAAGLPWHAWNNNFQRPMMRGEADIAGEAARRIAEIHGAAVGAFEIVVTDYRITTNGLEVTPRRVRFVRQGEAMVHAQP